MTESEAKKNITAYVYLKCLDMPSDVITALDVARIALEKQIPKKPIDRCMYKECPTCGNVEIGFCKHCPDCGQRLDWSDEHEID